MEIKSTLTNRSGDILDVIYRETDPLKDLEGKVLHGVHGYCFYKDKLILVYTENKKYWTPSGGGIEKGESYQEALEREVFEESNMKVLKQKFIGYQDIYEPHQIVRQTRSICIVEPYGDFVADPDGDVTKIELIEPHRYKEYFDWGEIGDYIMKKALEIKKNLLEE
tara:strand:- start:1021 stop:1518 length:498 start_codon:yes stop_codon:yes gene_type:complete